LSVPVRANLCWRATDHPGDLELRVSGELCVWTVSCLEPALWGLVSDRRPATVTVDLSGVTFIDARGVALLSRLVERLASWDGSLAITEPSRVVTRLLVLAGMSAPPVSSCWRGC
jgi:anti-anti-sigma factor